MDNFLPQKDALSIRIQEKAADLYGRLMQLNIDALGMPAHCLAYYKSSHSRRLFFSIETSAHLLYRSITMVEKRPEDVIIMDYGAGVGTLYLLAKTIGCGQVIYNDHLDDWRLSAQLIAEAIDIQIDQYIVGDIDDCLARLEELHIECDIITSRNVIEHIYKLDVFYSAIHHRQSKAIVYSSTTANINNPASVIKHMLWHGKWEKVYKEKRADIIRRQIPGLCSSHVRLLAKATRGLAGQELSEAIDQYLNSGKLPNPRVYATNTCEPDNGVWAEHLINTSTYKELINENWFNVSFAPGFWDTHYSKSFKNKGGKILNRIIRKGGKTAMRLSPFIYVIARPR